MIAKATRTPQYRASRQTVRREPPTSPSSDYMDAEMPNTQKIFTREAINLNTVIAVISFLGIFAGLVATWTSFQYRQTEASKWQDDHMELHAKLSADGAARTAAFNVRLDTDEAKLATLTTDMSQLTYQQAQLEKSIEAVAQRQDRMAESYGNQFTEIRSLLSNLTTQIALANNSLSRLEKTDITNSTPKDLKN